VVSIKGVVGAVLPGAPLSLKFGFLRVCRYVDFLGGSLTNKAH